jgi:hypothetical protein
MIASGYDLRVTILTVALPHSASKTQALKVSIMGMSSILRTKLLIDIRALNSKLLSVFQVQGVFEGHLLILVLMC